jgi:Zn-finger protein
MAPFAQSHQARGGLGVSLSPYKVGEFVGCSHGTNGTRLFGCLDCALVWHNQQADKASSTLAHHENWIMALRAEIRERDKNKTVAFPIEAQRGEDE